ncbi:integrase family protein [Altererythrobacter sp. SALINAS58]|uniref:tyrosine-type recombinase/integrase n=1 Tax=Alteripontixanthobacter muriae TaxID=2705546 RepID=UPI0015767B22|nr:integrase family protein [Alteripontixanthobacter muriae]NTZ42045.1 integrase family protein [Alteripontixanthobacter muriae]
MRIHFTKQQVQGLKAKATDKRQEHRDLGGQNLYIVVQPKSGETSFVIRPTVNGKQRRVTIGHFPDMSLADAREEAARHKSDIRQGKPLVRYQPAPEAIGITVKEAWDLYWQHEASTRKSADEKQRIFNKDVAPAIGAKLLSEVTRDDVASLVSRKFATAKTASNRLHSLLARFFRWCLTKGHSLTNLDSNPMESVVKMHSERSSARKRYLTEQELRWWFQALPAAGSYAPIHELLMRTLCRFSDILDLTWGEVVERDNGDVVLEIGETKNNQPHVVYLHPSAAKLLPKRPKDAKPEDRVFSVTSRSSKPVERIRKRMEEIAALEGRQVPHWQPHDYRRTGTTHLAGMMDEEDNPLVPDHILDRLLAHKEQRVIRHYNIYGYYREKKSALLLWNNKL